MAAHSLSTPSLAAVTHGLSLGGSSTFLLNLAKATLARGEFLPIISTAETNELFEDFAEIGVPIDTVSAKGRIYEDRLDTAYRILAAHAPRAVLACLSSESFEMLRLSPPGVVRLGIIQSDDPPPYEMSRRYAPWIDAMVGVSEEICDRLRGMPEFRSTRIAHIPYGIDFGATVERVERPRSAPLRLVYLGRIVEKQKRVSRLAALVEELHQRKVNVEFSFVGAGPAETELRAALSTNPLVRWAGSLKPGAVMPFLANQDVFVLLSDYEGLPLSLLEAMAAGVVPVVSDLPSGMREVVPEGVGVRIPIGDIQAAASAITRLDQDRSQLLALGRQATLLARTRYSASRMAAQYRELISEFPTKRTIVWPESAPIPIPLGFSRPMSWAFSGIPRRVRRAFRRIGN